MRFRLAELPVIAMALALATACADKGNEIDDQAPQIVEPPGELAQSDLQRIGDPNVSADDAAALVAENGRFATDLYQNIRDEDGNLIVSPHSISIALAMTYAGARGNTETEMAAAMHFDLGQEKLHPAFNDLDLKLAAYNTDDFELNIVNQLWGQIEEVFVPEFLDTLALNYGAGLRLLDFISDPERSREQINNWVEAATNDRIKDLLPQGTIQPSTRLVLTNAIYFNAKWTSPFEKNATYDATFHRLDGTEIAVPTMHKLGHFAYAQSGNYQAIELPYNGGDMALLVLVPDVGAFDTFEAELSWDDIEQTVAQLADASVQLALPKFEFKQPLDLKKVLQDMGMQDPFTGAADFSGIRATGGLMITDVLHQAFIRLDEDGTEAAAATAVIVGESSAPIGDVELNIDRPFLFLIRDTNTGTVLFVGRVLDPSA